MQFGEVRVDEAQGLILAHSMRLPTAMLKKGRILTAADVAALKAAGINFITGARLEATDLAEDEAARVIAHALAGDGITIGPAFAGRCNLFAAARGVLAVDRDRLDRLNLVDEAVTVATLHPNEIMARGRMLTTVKIIPFGVDRHVVDTCAAFASTGGPLVSVRPFRRRDVVLIATTLPGSKASAIDAALAVTRARIEALDGIVTQELRCAHEVGTLERTLTRALAGGCAEVLILGASATVDRRDVVPAAIQRAGGAIDHFGMPVDPGNLLLLGHVGAVPVVNLPGCARSAKPNGLDWVLRRLAAGLPITPRDMMRTGAGGLLKEIGLARPTARLPGFEAALGSNMPRVAAVILADGTPDDAARAVEAAVTAGLGPVIVVAATDLIEESLPTCDVRLVRGDAFTAGLSELPEDVDAAIIAAAGQGRVTATHLAELVRAYDDDEGRAMVVTVDGRTRIGPMLIGRDFLPLLVQEVTPESVLADHAEMVFEVMITPALSSSRSL